MLVHWFQIIANFLHVCQSVSLLASLLKLDNYGDISCFLKRYLPDFFNTFLRCLYTSSKCLQISCKDVTRWGMGGMHPPYFFRKNAKIFKITKNISSNILSTSPYYPPDYFSGCDALATINDFFQILGSTKKLLVFSVYILAFSFYILSFSF